jgi:putative membrane protein
MIVRYTRKQDRRCAATMPAARIGMAMAFAATLCARPAAAQTPVPPSAPDFATDAAQSDAYEIVAAQDALAQSHNPRVRAFAQQMIDDHTRMDESLRQAVTASGLPMPPGAMSSDQASLLSALQSLTGAEFDRTYARQQLLAHRQAIAVEQSYASAGSDANLRDAAQSALPMIQHHLEMAEQMREALGGS